MNRALLDRPIFIQRTAGECVAALAIFLLFFTSGADRLFFQVGFLKGKLNNGIALLVFIGLFASIQRIYLRPSLLIPSLLIAVSITISASQSPLPQRSFMYLFVYGIEFTLYFFTAYSLMLFSSTSTILSLYFLGYWAVAVHGLLQLLFSFAGYFDPFVTQYIGRFARPSSFFYEPSYFALYMCPFVMYYSAHFMLSTERSVFTKRLCILCCSHLLFLLSTSTGAFISYFIFFPAILLYKTLILRERVGPYFYRKYLAVVSGIFSLLLFLFISFQHVFRGYFLKFFTSDFFLHHSFFERWNGIKRAVSVFLSSPIFGKGIGGVGPYYYSLYHSAVDISSLTLQELEKYDPTNAFTEILATLGLFGLFAIGTFLWMLVKEIRRIILLRPDYTDEKTTAAALLFSWAITLIVLQFNQGLFRNYIWIHTGIVLGYMHKLLIVSKVEQKNM